MFRFQARAIGFGPIGAFFVIMAISAIFLGAGCDEGARSRVEPGEVADGGRDGGGSVDAAGDAVADGMMPDAMMPDAVMPDAVMPDAMMPDAVMPDAMPDAIPDAMPDAMPDALPDAGRCRVTIEIVPLDDGAEGDPIVDGEAVYFSARGPDGGFRAVRLQDRQPVGGPSDGLVAAREGAFLLGRPDGAGNARLIYRDPAGDRVLADPIGLPFQWSGNAWRPVRWVEPGRAIFVRRGQLSVWSGGDVEPVAELAEQAALDRGRVAWIESPEPDGPQEEWWAVHRSVVAGGEDRRFGPLEGQPLPASLRLTNGWLWLLTAEGRPRGYEVATGAGVAPAVAGCVALDAEGGDAVAVCADGLDQVLVRLTSTGAVERLARTAQIVGPRLRDGRVAFAAYDNRDAWCAAGPLEVGALYWADLAELSEPGVLPAPVAEIGSGCLCCGAFWPALVLEMGDDLLAWNYGMAGERDPALGIARRVCD